MKARVEKPKDDVQPYNPLVLEACQHAIESQRRRFYSQRLTPEQRRLVGSIEKTAETYLLLSEVKKMFAISGKTIKGFCVRHGVPTIQEPRKFRVAIVPFLTAYAQDTNVRTDEALRKRVRRELAHRNIMAPLDAATSRFFGQ
jgi:hypothetical protein